MKKSVVLALSDNSILDPEPALEERNPFPSGIASARKVLRDLLGKGDIASFHPEGQKIQGKWHY